MSGTITPTGLVESNKRMIKNCLRHEGGVIVLRDKKRTVDAEWVRGLLVDVIGQLELNNAMLKELLRRGGSE